MKKFILDATAGWREMWHDKNFPYTVFSDFLSDQELERNHSAFEKQRGNKGKPLGFTNSTVVMDFRKLKFPDESFKLVVFDPPHCTELTPKSFLFKKYGALVPETWQSDLKKAASELWRVLEPFGILILKWSAREIPLKSILKFFPEKPLFSQRTSKNTYWVCFMKMPKFSEGSDEK